MLDPIAYRDTEGDHQARDEAEAFRERFDSRAVVATEYKPFAVLCGGQMVVIGQQKEAA
jgi:hypothetical protein